MAIVSRGSVWDPFTTLIKQMDAEFDSLVRNAFGERAERVTGFVPATDVNKDGRDVVITLELPGIDVESDLEVEVAERRLVITGRRNEQRSSDDRGVLVREIRSGAFRREFALPEGVTADQVEAGYDRGMLTVRVREVARPAITPTKVKVRGLPSADEAPTTIDASDEG